jgi:hypothetical protein
VNSEELVTKANIKGIVLLDPTLSADPNYHNVGDLAPLVNTIYSAGIPLHIGDTIPIDDSNRNKSDVINLENYLPNLSDIISQYYNLGHLQLANDPNAFHDSITGPSGIFPGGE